ncbi:hypothetical protein TI05_04400 [Achromatium sp. WMS3]|nr:hypothetical protein TI05_04400 [Achromatium sp. WMS3]
MATIKSIRKLCRDKRNALSADEQHTHSLKIIQYLKHLRWLERAKHIAAYLATNGELNLEPLISKLRQADKNIYLPVLGSFPQRKLWFVSYPSNSILKPNRFNILEPVLGSNNRYPPLRLDVILVPIVAFDADCNRIGMGGGFYDRTLAYQKHLLFWKRPRLIGVAHECQRVEKIVMRKWDVPLDAIVTERKIYGNFSTT